VSKESDDLTMEITDAFDMFRDYALNIDSLTIKTGIPSLDKMVRMTIGMSVGLVAAPGVGKTTVAIQILNAMSKSNEQSIFFSYDMYHALVLQKLIQKHLHMSDEEIFDKFKKNDVEFEKQVKNVLSEEYKNVDFCFHTGQTAMDIEETIKYTEEKTGKKPRLIVVDYSELVLTDLSDMTASSSQVAQKLREIATKYNICVLVLMQPNKMAGSPADELTSYRNLKGSSSSEQALSVILGMSRPGYDPRRPHEDRFITIKCLKNRMGGLFTLDLGWNGMTGDIHEMTDEEENLLNEIRQRKENEENKTGDDWS
jgi:replicative DNA helicase